jgi:hypothetical protein
MIKKPLSKEILFGKLTNGGVVEVSVEDDKLKLNIIEVLPVVKVEKNADTETELQ